MKPETFTNVVCSLLYEKRFGPYFVEPIVAGLKPDNTPFISGNRLNKTSCSNALRKYAHH